jgi:hypothetical protein
MEERLFVLKAMYAPLLEGIYHPEEEKDIFKPSSRIVDMKNEVKKERRTSTVCSVENQVLKFEC